LNTLLKRSNSGALFDQLDHLSAEFDLQDLLQAASNQESQDGKR